MNRALKLFLLVLMMNIGVGPAWAQSGASSPSAGPSLQSNVINKSPRKQSLNFEDELVEGSAQKPELFYLFQKKNFNYKRLVKLRENFLPEMRKTTEDIQRLRGGR